MRPPSFGLSEEFKGYIPARTVIWPCQFWPQRAVMDAFQPSNRPIDEQNVFCQAIDTHITRAFEGEPYIKAFSSKAVVERLKSYNDGHVLKAFDYIKRSIPPAGTLSKENEVAAYQQYFFENPAWLPWLLNLSEATLQADAVLFPFLVTLNQFSLDDRGIFYNRTFGRIAFLLVDINTGKLIWARASSGQILTPSNAPQKMAEDITGKKEKDQGLKSSIALGQKLLTTQLWLGYPGFIGELNSSIKSQE